MSRQLIGFWRWVPSTRVFYADAALCILLGVDPAIGRAGDMVERFCDDIHRDDRHILFRRIDACAAVGVDFAERFRLIDDRQRARAVLTVGRCFGSAGRFCYVGAIFGLDESSTDIYPCHAAVIEHLLAAKSVADSLQETMLGRLIDAVLFEAGRSYARALQEGAD